MGSLYDATRSPETTLCSICEGIGEPLSWEFCVAHPSSDKDANDEAAESLARAIANSTSLDRFDS